MKKILTIISILIFSTSAYANNRLNGFNKWLFENGHTEYVEKGESELCKDEPIGSVVWYYNNCDQAKYKNNLKIKFYMDGYLKKQRSLISELCFLNSIISHTLHTKTNRWLMYMK